jgi:hypothetical protein
MKMHQNQRQHRRGDKYTGLGAKSRVQVQSQSFGSQMCTISVIVAFCCSDKAVVENT